MNKTISVFAVVAAVLLAAPTADAAAELRKFGFGASVDTIGNLTGNIEIPINLTPTFRVSPIISLHNDKTTTKPDVGNESSNATSTIGLGVGAYSLMRTEGPYLMYVGGRVGALLASRTVDAGSGEVVTSGMDIFVAGVLGSEYFFNPRFSLGGEISINVLLGGDREADKGDDKTEETTLNMAAASSVNVRFYF